MCRFSHAEAVPDTLWSDLTDTLSRSDNSRPSGAPGNVPAGDCDSYRLQTQDEEEENSTARGCSATLPAQTVNRPCRAAWKNASLFSAHQGPNAPIESHTHARAHIHACKVNQFNKKNINTFTLNLFTVLTTHSLHHSHQLVNYTNKQIETNNNFLLLLWKGCLEAGHWRAGKGLEAFSRTQAADSNQESFVESHANLPQQHFCHSHPALFMNPEFTLNDKHHSIALNVSLGLRVHLSTGQAQLSLSESICQQAQVSL